MSNNIQRQKELRREKNKAEKIKMKKRRKTVIICLIIAIVFIIGCVIFSISMYKRTNKYKTGTVVMSSENYSIDLAMYSFFFTDGYYGFTSLQGDDLKQMGMYPDITKSLHSQYYFDGTWYDYFANSAKAHAKQTLILAEAAKKEGITLTDGELAALEKRAGAYDASKYGKGITKDDILRCLILEYTAVKYEYEKRDAEKLEGNDLSGYYEKYYKHFSSVSFRRYEVKYGEGSGGVTPIDAEKYANEIKTAKNSDEFTEKLTAVLKKINGNISDEELKASLDSSFAENYAYSEGDIVTEWLFDSQRNLSDTYVYHNEVLHSYSVYLLTKLPEHTEEDTVTVRNILFSFDEYKTEDDARKAAEDAKGELLENNCDENVFKDLALEKTGDLSTRYLGGLYENRTVSELDEEVPGISGWCFDEQRKAYDVEIIKSENGYDLVMFIEKGLPSHLATVQKTVSGEDFSELYLSYETTYKINEDEDALSSYDPRR